MAHGHSTRWGAAATAFLIVLSGATVAVADNNKSDTTTSTTSASTSSTSTTPTTTTPTTSTQKTNENGNNGNDNGNDKGKSGNSVDSSTSSSTSSPPTSDASTDASKGQDKKDDTPVPVNAHAWSSTGNSRLAARAGDGDPSTEFTTQMLDWAPPTWAWLRADLGGNVPLTRVEWVWTQPGAADAFTVEVSAGNGKWIPIAQPGEAPVGQWTGVSLERETRFVRFSWRNPNGDAQLGHLGEVRFLARPGFVADDKGMTPNLGEFSTTNGDNGDAPRAAEPTMKGDHWVVKSSSRSSNSPEKSSRLPLDGKPETAWQTALSVAPRTGWTMYDLGKVVSVPAIKWKFSKVGAADHFLVQTSPNGVKWTTVAEQTNAPAADQWVRLDTNVETRFVRFFFTNPGGDPNIGFLSEVRFLHP